MKKTQTFSMIVVRRNHRLTLPCLTLALICGLSTLARAEDPPEPTPAPQAAQPGEDPVAKANAEAEVAKKSIQDSFDSEIGTMESRIGLIDNSQELIKNAVDRGDPQRARQNGETGCGAYNAVQSFILSTNRDIGSLTEAQNTRFNKLKVDFDKVKAKGEGACKIANIGSSPVAEGATPTTPTTPNMHDKAAFLLGAQFEGGALVNISGNGIVTRGAGAILGQLGFSTGGSFDLVGNLGVGINTVTKGFVPATLRAGLEVGISPWKEKRVKLLALFNYEGTAAQGAAMTSTDPTCVDQFGRPKADPFMRCTTGDHAMKWLQQYAVGVGVKGDFLPGAGSARIQPKFLASVGWGDEGGVSIMLNAAAAFDWNKTSK